MKNKFLKPIIALSLIITTLFSCGEDDIAIPDVEITNPDNGILLNEDFQSITSTGKLITLEGWNNINTADLNVKWRGNASDNNFFTETEKGGLSQEYDSWLITKQVDIKTKRTLKVSVDINVTNHNGNYLKIFIVDTVTGNTVNLINTSPIDMVPLENTDGFTTKESTITIPDNITNFRLGFKNQKNGNENSNTIYQIDNIIITEK